MTRRNLEIATKHVVVSVITPLAAHVDIDADGRTVGLF